MNVIGYNTMNTMKEIIHKRYKIYRRKIQKVCIQNNPVRGFPWY